MRGVWTHFATGLRLHFRNTMALLYGYLFPVIFLIAFWVLYRHEPVPLIRHFGELLTITILGGACLGLPTTIVSERERGVWRRYRLAPVSTATLVVSTVAARYVILISAALLQMALAAAIGMPAPRHPFDLWLAFTFVAFAFIGLGLVLAMLADNVPAVQALGQSIFLPMLIIGGVAVPLASLPEWAQRASSFLPGRYAVEALQATATGDGVSIRDFSLMALTVIGIAGCFTAMRLFRWESGQRFAVREGKAWVALALAAWVAVGLAAEVRGRSRAIGQTAAATPPPDVLLPVAPPAPEPPAPSPAPIAEPSRPDAAPPAAPSSQPPDTSATAKPKPTPPAPEASSPATGPPPPPPGGSTAKPQLGPGTWPEVTLKHIEADLVFDRLPSDGGIVTPIAAADEMPDQDQSSQLDLIWSELPYWWPGRVRDPVQRVRNYLFIPAVIDVFQMSIERFVPALIFERLQTDIPKDDLIKILYWIAIHPDQGSDEALDQLRPFGIGNGPSDVDEVRQRAAVYGVKLLGRLLGKIK